jgi:cytochrome c-type biogenesis protein CcmH/NrfG
MRSGQKSVSRRADKRRASGTDKSTAPLVTAPRVLLVLALALAVLSHIAALGFAFVDDDTTQVVGEPHIQSWQFLPQYFTQDIWLHKCGSNYYRPLFLTWMLLNYMFFGLEPLGWHAAVLLVHALATALVYVLVAKLWQDPLAAGFAALLFAVHPAAVEGVAWVAGANEPLMTVMFLVSLLCYLHARERGQKLWVWISALCYLAGLLVKETAIILPLLVLIYEIRFQGSKVSKFQGFGGRRTKVLGRETEDGRRGTVVRTLVPYAAAVLVYLGARGLALHGLAPAHRSSVSLVTVFSTWPAILWFYVKELIIPWPLGLYHTLPFVTQYRMGNFFGPLLGLIAIGAGLAAWSRREPRVGQTCAWLFLPLLPVMTSVAYFDRGQLVHDRYLYLPMVGMVTLGALALRRVKLLDITRFGLPLTQVVILSAVVCIFGIATVAQTGTWADNRTLYRHAVAVAPGSAPANVAWAQEMSAEDQPEAVLRYYRQALALDPDDFRTYYSLGFFQAHSRQWEDAEKSLLMVTQLKPEEPCVFFGLALVQKSAGKLREAEISLRHACSSSPVPEGAHFQLASLLESQGRLREAREELEAELAIGPDPRAEREIEELDQQGNRQLK